MPYIVSLQGGMASGKTTTARYIRDHLPGVTVSFENTAPVLAKVVAAGLSKFVLDDFIEIQRMYIEAEIERYYSLLDKDRVVLDLGPEEIEFYTLFFPQSIGMDWDMERLLHPELSDLRRCKLDGILFLDARNETLRRRAEADPTRSRTSFVHYMNHMHRNKKEWFLKSMITTFLQVDGRTPDEVGASAVKWLMEFGE
jgi:deoxyadenosine/deoxycytidine kinase